MRALIAEYELAPPYWVSVLLIVQSAINEAPINLLGRNSNGNARNPI